jgi:DNA-binding response OmpR family regulator
LHEYGLLLETFTSVEAMRARPEGPIIAVLLDVDLGSGVSGLDVARELREHRADLPIAFITANMAPERVPALLAIGSVFAKNADVAPAVEWLVAHTRPARRGVSESG